MTQKPINRIPITPSPAIASFNYTDISEGTGIVSFYGYSTDQEGTRDFQLSTNTFFSDEVASSGASHITTAGTFDMFDFDLTQFNLPKTLKGTATLQIPWMNTVSGNESNNVSMVAVLKKWDGTTETDITSGASDYISVTGSGGVSGNSKQLSLVSMDVPKTNFARGDILRLTIQAAVQSASGYGVLAVAHDPQNRDEGSDDLLFPGTTGFTVGTNIDTTTMKLDIPFRLDI